MRSSLTRSVTLSARHHYGTTGVGNGRARDHGHLYRVDVTVATLGGARSTVIDLEYFDAVLAGEIVAPLDGRQLNEAIAEFASGAEPPTCEALAAWCWRRVARRLPADVRLERVRVAEDESLAAECRETE